MPFFYNVMTMSLVGQQPLEGGRAPRGRGSSRFVSVEQWMSVAVEGNKSSSCLETEDDVSIMSVPGRTICSWRYAGVIISSVKLSSREGEAICAMLYSTKL